MPEGSLRGSKTSVVPRHGMAGAEHSTVRSVCELTQPPNAANREWLTAALARLRGFVWLLLTGLILFAVWVRSDELLAVLARVVLERGPALPPRAAAYLEGHAC